MSRGEKQRIVVIGAGQAAAQLADQPAPGRLCRRDPDRRRRAVSALSAAAAVEKVSDRTSAAGQPVPAAGSLLARDWTSTWCSASPAAGIDPRSKTVTLADGREFAYGALVLATGTRARALPLPGTALPNVFSLRAIGDVQRAATGARRGRAHRHRRRRLYRPRGRRRACAARAARSPWSKPRTACSSGSPRRWCPDFSTRCTARAASTSGSAPGWRRSSVRPAPRASRSRTARCCRRRRAARHRRARQ